MLAKIFIVIHLCVLVVSASDTQSKSKWYNWGTVPSLCLMLFSPLAAKEHVSRTLQFQEFPFWSQLWLQPSRRIWADEEKLLLAPESSSVPSLRLPRHPCALSGSAFSPWLPQYPNRSACLGFCYFIYWHARIYLEKCRKENDKCVTRIDHVFMYVKNWYSHIADLSILFTLKTSMEQDSKNS